MNKDEFKSLENALPQWKGFAWFGLLLMENRLDKTTLTVRAGGVYCQDGKGMKFHIYPKTVTGCFSGNFNDYDAIGYITDKDKEI
jgi:hypothetical protein